MASLLIRHKVENYERWKPVFDEDDATRRASGSTGYRLYRNAHDPNEIVAVTEWGSIEQAQRFAASPDLRAKMERGGVADQPSAYFLEEVEHDPA
jgi:quinol monooxygenase YgiN